MGSGFLVFFMGWLVKFSSKSGLREVALEESQMKPSDAFSPYDSWRQRAVVPRAQASQAWAASLAVQPEAPRAGLGFPATVELGGEGASEASSLWSGRKGNKGPEAAARMRGPSGCRAHAAAGAQARGAGAGRRAGAAATRVLAVRRGPPEGPGSRLACPSVGKSATPEARDARDGSRAAPPRMQF